VEVLTRFSHTQTAIPNLSLRFSKHPITAFAILGSTPVDRVIVPGRRGMPLPQCPNRYFSDEQEAHAWLR